MAAEMGSPLSRRGALIGGRLCSLFVWCWRSWYWLRRVWVDILRGRLLGVRVRDWWPETILRLVGAALAEG